MPVIEGGEHVGWELDEAKVQAALESWRASVEVSRYQAFAALDDFGLLDQVEAWAANQPRRDQLAFKEAQVFKYNSPTLNKACEKLGITQAQKDQLFQHGETLEA